MDLAHVAYVRDNVQTELPSQQAHSDEFTNTSNPGAIDLHVGNRFCLHEVFEEHPIGNVFSQSDIDRGDLSGQGLVAENIIRLGGFLNQRHYQSRQGDSELAARMLSFKTANSLQKLAPELFDLSKESDKTLELYGVSRDDRQSFGWQTLVARRMAEAGVRFIELVDTGSHSNWDAHSRITRHEPLAQKVDQPMAALINDLKLRGMLDDTLIICCTEFGRTAYGKKEGRNHHKNAFSCWLAGGGSRPGQVYGETDELGLEVAKDPVHVHDFHETILHLLGLDHEQITYRHSGRDFRLTDVFGNVVTGLLA